MVKTDLIILTKSLDLKPFMLVATGCLLISHAPSIFVRKIKSLFSYEMKCASLMPFTEILVKESLNLITENFSRGLCGNIFRQILNVKLNTL